MSEARLRDISDKNKKPDSVGRAGKGLYVVDVGLLADEILTLFGQNSDDAAVALDIADAIDLTAIFLRVNEEMAVREDILHVADEMGIAFSCHSVSNITVNVLLNRQAATGVAIDHDVKESVDLDGRDVL